MPPKKKGAAKKVQELTATALAMSDNQRRAYMALGLLVRRIRRKMCPQAMWRAPLLRSSTRKSPPWRKRKTRRKSIATICNSSE
jgi:hypothetical protein